MQKFELGQKVKKGLWVRSINRTGCFWLYFLQVRCVATNKGRC